MKKGVAATAICIAVLLSLIAIPIANADWPMFHANPTHDGVCEGNAIFNATQLWNFTTDFLVLTVG